MTSEPFDEEWEKDKLVPADAMPSMDQPPPIETVKDFKRRLTKLRPDELAFLWARMEADKPSGDSHSQSPG